MEVRISNMAIVRIWVSHFLLCCAWTPHSQMGPILSPHLTPGHHQTNFGVSPFHFTFLLLSSSKEHYVRRYKASAPPCWTCALKVYGKALGKAFPKQGPNDSYVWPYILGIIPPIYLFVKCRTDIILNLYTCRLGGVFMPSLKSKND